MTWREFKESVERQLKEKGLDESAPLWWIEVSYPNSRKAHVERDKDLGITISN